MKVGKRRKEHFFVVMLEAFLRFLTVNINFTSKIERWRNRNIILHTFVSSSGKVYKQAEITSCLCGFLCPSTILVLYLHAKQWGSCWCWTQPGREESGLWKTSEVNVSTASLSSNVSSVCLHVSQNSIISAISRHYLLLGMKTDERLDL